jgi:tetratricopeptide (TPR) repeat protein
MFHQNTSKLVSSVTASLILIALTTGCVKPRQTTAIGSGVGGAIGAGLGAIVGNQTGNAGSGLAIGAGAGAAVGALVGNALQAEQERNKNQDEAIKRQEQVIKAQKNEINELRAIRGDDSYALNTPPSHDTPRYRFRGTTTPPESPEVARQRAKLQQRGPSPRGGTTSPRGETSVKQLARYDIRSELSTNSKPEKKIPAPPAKTINNVAAAPKLPESPKLPEKIEQSPSKNFSESDIPTKVGVVEATAKAASPAESTQSKECKAALAERDLAAEASDNSDKLFHLRRALRLCPHSAPLHHELGKVYASMQRTKDAEGEFQQALEIDPSFNAAKKELGALLKDEVHF